MAETLIAVNMKAPSGADRRLIDAHAFWQSLRKDTEIPYRRDFKPTALRGLLPFMFLVDVLSNPRDFRFRLTGSEFRDRSGQDLTGRMISEAFPQDFAAEVHQAWSSAVDDRRPRWGQGRLWVKERDHVQWQGVVLPLQNDDGIIHQLLGSVVFGMAA